MVIECPTCSARPPEGAKFCGSCGAVLAAACLACSTPLTPGARFCAECGTPAGAAAPPSATVWLLGRGRDEEAAPLLEAARSAYAWLGAVAWLDELEDATAGNAVSGR